MLLPLHFTDHIPLAVQVTASKSVQLRLPRLRLLGSARKVQSTWYVPPVIVPHPQLPTFSVIRHFAVFVVFLGLLASLPQFIYLAIRKLFIFIPSPSQVDLALLCFLSFFAASFSLVRSLVPLPGLAALPCGPRARISACCRSLYDTSRPPSSCYFTCDLLLGLSATGCFSRKTGPSSFPIIHLSLHTHPPPPPLQPKRVS